MAKTMEEVLERFRTIEFHEDFDMIVAIANGGIVPAGIINQRLQKEVHLLRINLRDEYQHPKYDRLETTICGQSMTFRNYWRLWISTSRARISCWWTTV